MKIAALGLLCALIMANAKINESDHRRLSYPKVGGYSPQTQVTDQCAIDQDQASMEGFLAIGTNDAFATAQLIYNQGGNSKSYAEITLGKPLIAAVQQGTQMIGENDKGSSQVGKTYEYYEAGTTVVKFRYLTSDSASDHVGCRVGALPLSQQKIVGCLVASGSVSIGSDSYNYTYVPSKDNNNGRTLSGFSINAIDKMRLSCDGCPYRDHKYYYDYYGVDDYGQDWVTAAFSGEKTKFSRGNADFSIYGFPGRTQAIKKGTVYFNIFHNVIREFENSIDICERGCDQTECINDAVHAWDEGVCFYTGSIEGETGETLSGVLLHQLADKRCINFRTCGKNGEETSGKAKTNIELLKLINVGKFQIQGERCSEARQTLRDITRLMYVSFIQGSLRYAYKIDLGGQVQATEAARAEGAVFAAAVLPRIYAADPDAAATIYENLKTGAGSTDFVTVKKAFESVYLKLKIGCDEVGGIWNEALGTYYKGAEPCADGIVQIGEETNDQQLLVVILGSTLGGLFFVALLALYFIKRRNGQSAAMGRPEFESTDEVMEVS